MCNQRCQTCCCFTCSQSIVVTTGSQVLITIPAQTLNNRQRICLCLAQNFAATTEPVFLQVGTNKLPLLRSDGNQVRGGQLRTRRKYTLQIATTPASAIVRSNNLCPICFVQPQIPLTGAATPAVATTQEVTATKK